MRSDYPAGVQALEVVNGFEPGWDDLAAKSKELTVGLLRESRDPFSRAQFAPGHITCTALVIHPGEARVLLMHHHRLRRWLLPGGHVEPGDLSLAAAAIREALEETKVRPETGSIPVLAGIDVHGIPPKRDEPWHLHHDLIWFFRAASAEIEATPEAVQVLWASAKDVASMDVTESIRRAVDRCRALGPA